MKTLKKRYSKKRGPVRAKKVTFDGINFASGLEKYMYTALKSAKIGAIYEGATFELQGVSIEECIESAYDEIKNRKGKMVNGTYKKD